MTDESWKPSFRKRHRTLFTKAHKLQSQAPENIRVHIVVQRIDDDDVAMFCWNSHPDDPAWPPSRDQMNQATCKTMTPEDMQRDAERRSRARKKKARPRGAPQTADDAGSESSEIEIRNLFEMDNRETDGGQDAFEDDNVETCGPSDAMFGLGWHMVDDQLDNWHTPPLYPRTDVLVPQGASPSAASSASASKREASSPAEEREQKTARREEMVSRPKISPPSQVDRIDRRRAASGLQPLVFPTSPL